MFPVVINCMPKGSPPPPPPRRWWGFDQSGVKSIQKPHPGHRGNGQWAPTWGGERPVHLYDSVYCISWGGGGGTCEDHNADCWRSMCPTPRVYLMVKFPTPGQSEVVKSPVASEGGGGAGLQLIGALSLEATWPSIAQSFLGTLLSELGRVSVLRQNQSIAIDIVSLTCSRTVITVLAAWTGRVGKFTCFQKKKRKKKRRWCSMKGLLGKVQADWCQCHDSRSDSVLPKAELAKTSSLAFVFAAPVHFARREVRMWLDWEWLSQQKMTGTDKTVFFVLGSKSFCCTAAMHIARLCGSFGKRNAGPGSILHQHDGCSRSSHTTVAFSCRNHSLETVQDKKEDLWP